MIVAGRDMDPGKIRISLPRCIQVIIERERENQLFAELSRLGFAPPYLGRFTNGRIEGYLNARPLAPEEMGQSSPVDFVGFIGRELARLHGMQVGGDRAPLLWTLIDKWAALAAGRSRRTLSYLSFLFAERDLVQWHSSMAMA